MDIGRGGDYRVLQLYLPEVRIVGVLCYFVDSVRCFRTPEAGIPEMLLRQAWLVFRCLVRNTNVSASKLKYTRRA